MRRGGYIAAARHIPVTVSVAVFAAVFALPTGCVSGRESVAVDVSPIGWHEAVELHYTNLDTVAVKKLHLAIRHGAALTAGGGRYVFETASPAGVRTCDTLSIEIASALQGNKLYEAWAAPVNVRFAEEGEYRLSVRPLRGNIGVWSVGVDIGAAR